MTVLFTPLIRGDTLIVNGSVAAGGTELPLLDAEILVTAKLDPQAPTTGQVFQLSLGAGVEWIEEDDGTFTFTIQPAHTANLAAPATLYCDVEITESDGRRSTERFDIPLVVDITRH